MLGKQHLRTLTILGFPNTTRPGLLDALNHLDFAYRWMTRFIALDKTEATKTLTKLRRQWFNKRKSITALLREVMYNEPVQLLDTDADNKVVDADAALQALGGDHVAFGYLTTTVTVFDEDRMRVEEKVRAVERIINGLGFTTIRESLNAVEAWLGSLPGHVYANVRQPLVHTLNLAHLMPLSSVWAGPTRNEHLDGPPLLLCGDQRLDAVPLLDPCRRCRPYADRRSDRRRQVGAARADGDAVPALSAVAGLYLRQGQLGTRRCAGHGRRAPRARLRWLAGLPAAARDRRRGGAQLGRGMDRRAARAREGRGHAGGQGDGLVGADQPRLGAAVRSGRSPALSVLLQSNALKSALLPYTLEGPFGRLLDAAEDSLALADVQCFETESLLHETSVVLPVLTYLFHRLEARFDGRPTLLILDEAWVFLDNPLFAARIREWLKVLRKKNVSVVFATQSLADIANSSIAPAIIESCPQRIFLPNDRAIEPQGREAYERFGLNDRQIELIARAVPSGNIICNRGAAIGCSSSAWVRSRSRSARASSPPDQTLIERVLASRTIRRLRRRFLAARGLDWAASLLRPHRNPAGGSHEMQILRTILLATALSRHNVLRLLTPNGPCSMLRTLPRTCLQAARALQQINNQIQSLQNEATMLQNMGTNLKSLNMSQLGNMVSALTQISTLMNQGQGIAFNVNATNTAFTQTYPQSYPAGTPQSTLAADALKRWQDAMAAFQQTLQIQAQVAQNVQADTATLTTITNASQGAVGNLQASQATNQLLALSDQAAAPDSEPDGGAVPRHVAGPGAQRRSPKRRRNPNSPPSWAPATPITEDSRR